MASRIFRSLRAAYQAKRPLFQSFVKPPLPFLPASLRSNGAMFSAIKAKHHHQAFRRAAGSPQPAGQSGTRAGPRGGYQGWRYHHAHHRQHCTRRRSAFRSSPKPHVSALKLRAWLAHKRSRWVDCERQQAKLVDHRGLPTRFVPAQLFLPQVPSVNPSPVAQPKRYSARPIVQPGCLLPAHAFLNPARVSRQNLGSARLFSSFAPCPTPPCIKPRTLLRAITVIARVFLSLFPIVLRSRIVHLRHATIPTFFNSRTLLISLFALPVGLLGATLVMFTQDVPLTGRKRVLLVDAAEKQEIVDAFAADTSVGRMAVADPIHWYHILRKVLREDQNPAGTLFGGAVLLDDSREQWVKQTLQLLGARGSRSREQLLNLKQKAAWLKPHSLSQ
jgi:hypothetical protein